MLVKLLQEKIEQLEGTKKDLVNKDFDSYDIGSHMDTYIELSNIDFAKNFLSDMMAVEMQKILSD